MNRPTFLMLCGLPCSGKSTKAIELATEYNATIFSSDALREELFGDINCQTRNEELFRELHRRIKDCLKSGKSAIYDACNVHYKERKAFLDELKKIPCEKICIIMATPFEECLRRSENRDRKVPRYVIERMYRAFDPPWFYEGWNQIEIEYSTESQGSYGMPFAWIESVMGYNQDNPHHTLTLGQHCQKAWYWTYDQCGSIEVQFAALLHDCGKIKTKTFVNSKGETTDVAHYYSHEHCGSYDSLFYLHTVDQLRVAVIIRWHMQPYFWERDNNEKLHNKYRKLWGEDLYKDIMLLHEADVNAH